ncbi:hypothetical protein V3C99_016424 [Haemonchus contortus]
MRCFLRSFLLVLVTAATDNDQVLKMNWCDLYGRVDGEGNHTTVIFQKLQSQFNKDFYRDLSCLMYSASFFQLPASDIRPKIGGPCSDIVDFINSSSKLSSPTAVILMGTSCDIQATSTALKGIENHDQLSFWKVKVCINCSFTSLQYVTEEGNPIHFVAMPAIPLSRLVPNMESVHALANLITGAPVNGKLKGLYVPIASPEDPFEFRISKWEKSGYIAALVTLLFLFFIIALFICCCACAQSALIIEDFNHREEMEMIWRLQENEQLNVANPPPEADNLSMHSEATQGSVGAESEHALL